MMQNSSRSEPRNRIRDELRIEISGAAVAGFSTFKSYLTKAHRLLDSPLRDLSIALVNDSRMSQLHKQFMGISGPTDVLTFPLELNYRKKPISGEIVVCVPEARRSARELGIHLKYELLLYMLHGLLHLSGFDDRTSREYRRMHRMEDLILRRLGIGPVFFNRPGLAESRPKARHRGRGSRQ